MKYTSILFLLLFAYQSVAQETTWGPEYANGRNESMEELVAKDQYGFYVLRSRQVSGSRYLPVLDHYDTKMKLQYSRPLQELDKVGIFYTDLFHYNNKLYVTFTKFRPQDQKHVLYFNEVNKKDGSLVDVPKKVAQIFSDKRLMQGEFQFEASPDSTKAILLFSEVEKQKGFLRNVYGNFDGSSVKFSLNVYDKKMNELWQKEVTLPYDENLLERSNLLVNNKGDAHIIAKVYENQAKDRARGQSNYNYKIFSYYQDGSTKEYTFDLGEKYISEITMRTNRKNELICSGFYSERNSNDVKGVFYFTIDEETREMSQKKLTPFTPEFLTSIMSERKAAKGRELQGFVLRDLVLRSDNGAVLIAEQFYTKMIRTPDYGAGGYVRYDEVIYYYYNDILVVNINPDGSIAWLSSVDKRQVSTVPTYSSFATAIVRDKIYFAYNGGMGKRQSVQLATVTSKGEAAVKDLFTNREAEVVTIPKLSRQMAKDEMVIYGESRKRFRFAKVKF